MTFKINIKAEKRKAFPEIIISFMSCHSPLLTPHQPCWPLAFSFPAPVGNEFTKDGEHAFNRAICTQVCNIEMKPSTHTC